MGNLHSTTADKAPFYPLTSVQQVIWLDQMLVPESPCYSLGAILEIDGTFDHGILESVFNEIANANDTLRLVVCYEAGDVRQQVLPSVKIALDYVDFSSREDTREAARKHMQACFDTPLKLNGELLWKVRLVRESDERVYLMHWYHHIIIDGTSVSLICQDVADLYNRRMQGDATPLASGLSYLEFLNEDQEYLASLRYERDARYWRHRFTVAPPPLFAPSDRRHALTTPSNGKVLLTIERSRYEALNMLGREFGCTITHVMVAVMALYFARVRGVGEIVIGVPVHNRASARKKRALGAFASVIPLGIPVDRYVSFASLMTSVAREMQRCYRHQRFPIADINRLLNLIQSGRHQAFDVIFSLEAFTTDIYFENTKLSVDAIRHRFEQTPLAVHLQDYHAGAHVSMEFNYDSTRLDQSEMENIRRHIELLITSVLTEGSSCRVGRLSWLTDEERHRVLYDLNATAVEHPKGRFLHTLFEQHAEVRPQAIAVMEGGIELSYQALNRRANRLARFLRTQGVVPDSLIAICMERSTAMIVSLLAILKAGGAYLPLDPAYPRERLAFMAEASHALAVLVDAAGQEALSAVASSVTRVNVQDDAALWKRFPEENLHPLELGLTPKHLAYVIYTSGSTGRPKGVMIEHRNLNSLITEMAVFGVRPGDRILQFASMSFDASVGDLVMSLGCGGCLCLADREAIVSGKALLGILHRQRINCMFLPPSAMTLCDPARLPDSVRTIITGGEVLPIQTARNWAGRIRLFNAYGPTENTMLSTFHVCQAMAVGPVPIGRPTANTRIYILDQDMQPVPVGVEGELYIGGDGVARGYLGQPELTTERFLEDPFHGDGEGRMYKTGDLGRWREDGIIEFLGRNDQQVKIRGFRIELGEIESVLGEEAGVQEVVVIVRDEGDTGAQLVAYYTGAASPAAEALRERAKSRLPGYMVPSAYVHLESLPLMPSGKLDRQRLPAPGDGNRAFGMLSYEPPQGAVEELLSRIWNELLKVERIGRRDNFFELGGHSLLAMQLISRLRQEGLHVEIGTLYNAPTLAEVAGNSLRMKEVLL